MDLAILLSIPVILGTFQYFGSEHLQTLLTFNSEQPSLHGLFGHWAIHYSPLLLFDNLLGYAVVGGFGYGLAWLIDERWWFRLSFVTILLLVPAGSTVISTHAFEAMIPGFSYRIRGFSAVVAGLLGLVYVFYLGTLCRIYDTRAAISGGGLVLILGLTGLLATVANPSPITLVALGGSAIAIGFGDSVTRIVGGHGVQWRVFGSVFVLSIAITAVLLGFFVALFPADPFAGETVTNVFSHGSGFMLGAVITFWGHRYWTQSAWIAADGPIL